MFSSFQNGWPASYFFCEKRNSKPKGLSTFPRHDLSYEIYEYSGFVNRKMGAHPRVFIHGYQAPRARAPTEVMEKNKAGERVFTYPDSGDNRLSKERVLGFRGEMAGG